MLVLQGAKILMQKNITRIDVADYKILEKMSDECFVINTAIDEGFCRKFIEKATIEDRLVLFYGEDAIEKCKLFNADGVVLDLGAEKLKEKMQGVRKQLGKGKFVGLFTRCRRHESMLVSEVEPEFVIFKVFKDGFENIKELTDWYNDFFVIQSASWIMEEIDEAEIKKLKTDFVIR